MNEKVLIIGSGDGNTVKRSLVAIVEAQFKESVTVITPEEAKGLSGTNEDLRTSVKPIVLEYTNPYAGIKEKIIQSTPKSGQQLRRERRAQLRNKNKKRP